MISSVASSSSLISENATNAYYNWGNRVYMPHFSRSHAPFSRSLRCCSRRALLRCCRKLPTFPVRRRRNGRTRESNRAPMRTVRTEPPVVRPRTDLAHILASGSHWSRVRAASFRTRLPNLVSAAVSISAPFLDRCPVQQSLWQPPPPLLRRSLLRSLRWPWTRGGGGGGRGRPRTLRHP